MLEDLQLITNVGFPIFMCLLLLKRMQEQDNVYKENESKLREVIERNTLAITQLLNERGVTNGTKNNR